jgi:futalosine hydrolase
MKIMVVAATALELSCIRDLDRIEPNGLITAVHGVGQVAATYQLTALMDSHQPDIILQVGIAGGFSNEIFLGEAVAVETEYLADMGVEEKGKFHSIFDMQLVDENANPFQQKKLPNPHMHQIENSGLKKVTGITVNQITTSTNQINYYKETYHPSIESMEGAAFHYCCLMKKIPFLQIRAVSNQIGERDKSKWEIKKSLDTLHKTMNEILKNISKG